MPSADFLARIEQKKSLFRRQTLEITRDHRLVISVRGLARSEKFEFFLRELTLNSYSRQGRELRPLIVAGPLGLIVIWSLGAMCWALWAGDFWGGYLTFAFVFGALAAPFVVMMMLKSYDLVIFEGVQSQRLVLWRNNPTREKFDAFVAVLREAIGAAQIAEPSADSPLAKEIETLKSQLDRGILTAEQFEAAKNKILGIDVPPSRIGF